MRRSTKSIAADPTKADAYYQKGVNLINKATTDPKTGKVIPAPGHRRSLEQISRTAAHRAVRRGRQRACCQYIGSSIETSYGKKEGRRHKEIAPIVESASRAAVRAALFL